MPGAQRYTGLNIVSNSADSLSFPTKLYQYAAISVNNSKAIYTYTLAQHYIQTVVT